MSLARVSQKPFYGIHIARPILFRFNRAVLRKASFAVLDQVAALIKKNPRVCVEIQAHQNGPARY